MCGTISVLTDRGKVGLLTNISPARMAVHCTPPPAPVSSGCTPKQWDLQAEIIINGQILFLILFYLVHDFKKQAFLENPGIYMLI